MKKIFLALILLLGLALRLYKIDIALADHHSWRQADTAAVARNYIKEGWDFLRPKIDNMTPLHPNLPNDKRLFLVEPPVYNSIVAGVYSVLGVDVQWARAVSIVFFLGSVVFLYLIVLYFLGEKTALFSAFFFTVLPYNIFYSRVVLPEPMIVFFTLGMFYFCLRWLEKESFLFYLLFILFSAVSFSQKAFPLFLLLPIGYLLWRRFGFKSLVNKKVILWAIVSFLPLILWRWWIGHFPEGIPANTWLFNQGDIRFKGAFFYWIFAKRIGELILGGWGLPLLVAGIVLKPKKEGSFFLVWLASLLLYITIFAAGNVTHDYYQIPLIPILSVFLAKGSVYFLFESSGVFIKTIRWLTFVICLSFMIAFSWYQVRDFYNIQSGVDLAGEAVDRLAPKNALVLTGDSNDATLLYNTNRLGWTGGYASAFPNEPGVIEKMRGLGAGIYVATKFDRNSEFGKYLLSHYPVLEETNQYIVFSLKGDR